MGIDGRMARRDAMLEAVEGEALPDRLGNLVRDYVNEGADLLQLYEDLLQIQPLLPEHEGDLVLDVLDFLCGDGNSKSRIGPYAWGDPRNVIWQAHQAGTLYRP